MVKHAEGAPLPESVSVRVGLVFFGMLQITLGAGLIVGWAGIAGSMLVSPEAGLTLDQTTKLYGVAGAVNYLSPLVLGFILDKFGPRTCSVISNLTVAVGCAVFGLAQHFTEFAIGASLMAFGGPGVQTSLMHTGNLFPERRFFVMGCVAESITLSFAVFPVLDVIWESTGVSFRSLFLSLATLVGLSSIGSVLLWPDSPFEVIEERDGRMSVIEISREEAMEEALKFSQEAADVVVDSKDDFLTLHEASFYEQVTSGVYLRLSIFFLITSWWANFYIATVTTELGDQQIFDEDLQHTLARQLSFIDAGAIVCAPLSGYMLDSVGFPATAVATLGLGLAQMMFLLVANDSQMIMIASFAAYAVFRAFLFPYFFASLSRKLGFRFFGVLSGLSFGISGLSQFAIAPIAMRVSGTCHQYNDDTEDCDSGRWTMIHWVQIGALLLLGMIPILDTLLQLTPKPTTDNSQQPLLEQKTESYDSTK